MVKRGWKAVKAGAEAASNKVANTILSVGDSSNRNSGNTTSNKLAPPKKSKLKKEHLYVRIWGW